MKSPQVARRQHQLTILEAPDGEKVGWCAESELSAPDLEQLVHRFLRLDRSNQAAVADIVELLADPPSALVGNDPTHEMSGRLGRLVGSLERPSCGCCA